MKRLVLILLWGLMLVTPMYASRNANPQRIDHNDFKKKLERYIIKEADLTWKEASEFFPIFHEMKRKQMEIGHQMMKLKKECVSKSSTTDAQWKNSALEIESLKVKQAQIGLEYRKKMSKVLSGKKLFRAMMAEDAFHKQMLKGFENRKRNQK